MDTLLRKNLPQITSRNHLLLLLGACAVFSELRNRQLNKEWAVKRVFKDGEAFKRHWVLDHPYVCFLLENTSILLVVALGDMAARLPVDRKDPMVHFKFWRTIFIRGTIMIEGMMMLQKFQERILYSHRPYFSDKQPSSDLRTILSDYFNCNFMIGVFNGFLIASMAMTIPKKEWMHVHDPAPMPLASIIGKLAFSRVIADIAFYATHRLLHTDYMWWLHRRHHEHKHPRIQTNYHFDFLDLFLEANLPLWVATLTLKALKIPVNKWEQSLLFASVVWFEIGSHCGKELPTVTWMPFLSPVIDYFFHTNKDIVKYHTRHHQLVKCNYCISPWLDKLLGSYKLENSQL